MLNNLYAEGMSIEQKSPHDMNSRSAFPPATYSQARPQNTIKIFPTNKRFHYLYYILSQKHKYSEMYRKMNEFRIKLA